MNDDSAAPEQVLLTWETRIRLLGNLSLWRQMLLVFGIPSALLGILAAFVAKRAAYAVLVPLAATGGFLAVCTVIAAAIDLFDGFKAIFILSSLGVRSLTGKVARAASAAAVVGGLLTGNLSAVGAGLLAESEQNVWIPWGAVGTVKVSARRRIVTVGRGWRFKPVALCCTPENFPQVLGIVRSFAADKVE